MSRSDLLGVETAGRGRERPGAGGQPSRGLSAEVRREGRVLSTAVLWVILCADHQAGHHHGDVGVQLTSARARDMLPSTLRARLTGRRLACRRIFRESDSKHGSQRKLGTAGGSDLAGRGCRPRDAGVSHPARADPPRSSCPWHTDRRTRGGAPARDQPHPGSWRCPAASTGGLRRRAARWPAESANGGTPHPRRCPRGVRDRGGAGGARRPPRRCTRPRARPSWRR